MLRVRIASVCAAYNQTRAMDPSLNATTVLAAYGAAVSTAVGAFGIWNIMSSRRVKLFVDLHPLSIVNTGEPLRIGLAVKVVNIGSVPAHVEGAGIPVDKKGWRHVGLHEHVGGEKLPGKLLPGDHVVYFVELDEARVAGLTAGHARAFVTLSGKRKRRWYSTPLHVPAEGKPFRPPKDSPYELTGDGRHIQVKR